MLCSGIFTTCAILLAIISSSQCQQRPALSNNLLKDVDQVGTNIESFCTSLVYRTIIDSNFSNVNISPFSVWAMLIVLSEGANGWTYKEMSQVLRNINPEQLRNVFPAIRQYFIIRTPTVQLETANAIFTDMNTSIKPEFSNLVKNIYDTQFFPVDFKNANTAKQINEYVSRATQERIRDIVNKEDLINAKMILTNAIFFKGQWTMPFNASDTKRETFYNDKASPIGQVNMMYQKGAYPYVNMKKLQSYIVELPYGKARERNDIYDDSENNQQADDDEENRISMIVILPHRGVSLGDVLNKLKDTTIRNIMQTLEDAAEEYADSQVDVYIPRFSISSDLTLNKILNNMGMYEVFDPILANLTRLSRQNDMYLSKVIHKATIEVTEEGTVASAATAGVLADRITPPKLVANKPFIYLIVDRTTKIILFGGSFSTPELF